MDTYDSRCGARIKKETNGLGPWVGEGRDWKANGPVIVSRFLVETNKLIGGMAEKEKGMGPTFLYWGHPL